MTTTRRTTLGLLLAAALVLAGVLWAGSGRDEAGRPVAPDPSAASEYLVRADSHRLSPAPAGSVTLVEFLDLECESCRAVYPTVEELRAEYGDQVSFVARYFPLPSHTNSENAAVAVEAAAQQGAFEAMYGRMYETQPQWGESDSPLAGVFRGFAADLGLDVEAFDRAVADPATLRRVRADRDDGVALGVAGTPTFFLDGEPVELTSVEDLRSAVEGALAALR